MKIRKILVLLVILTLSFGTIFKVYAVSNKISLADLQDIENRETMEKIAQQVVGDMGKETYINSEEVSEVTVDFGTLVKGNGGDDAVISAKFGPKLTLVAVYERKNGGYEFLSPVGTFYDVQEITLEELKNLEHDAIFIAESIDHAIGSFEKTRFLRGYIVEDKESRLIFSTPDQIKTDWNKIWDSKDLVPESAWERVTQSSKIQLEKGNYPKITAEKNQKYLISKDTEAKNIPNDETFEEEATRKLSEVYYWSDTYRSFILDEKMEKETGKKVAVLEYLNNLPYTLTNEFKDSKELVRILRKDGSNEIIEAEKLDAVK